MYHLRAFFLVVCLTVVCHLSATDIEYQLSRYSEDYNTRYFYCENFDRLKAVDEIQYVEVEIPTAFVAEIGALNDGSESVLVYNDNQELIVSKKGYRYQIDGITASKMVSGESKLSFYFVNGKLLFYIDEDKKYEKPLKLDRQKKFGIKWSAAGKYNYRFLNCFEPVPFKVADYGKALEDGALSNKKGIRMSPHNVGAAYSLTFPQDVTCNSKRSIRFEYRYEDTKADGVNSMRRARSEISGVFCSSPMNKWIIEYDLYIPEETIEDKNLEIVTQLHEHSVTPVSPSFCLWVKGGYIGGTINGDSAMLTSKPFVKKKVSHHHSGRLAVLSKGKWYHVKIYVKEGYQISALPVTKVWIDSKLVLESITPNCYKYNPSVKDSYNYLKFGIYKSPWMKSNVVPQTDRRIYFFDNYVVRY